MEELFEAVLGAAGWGVGIGVLVGALTATGGALRPVAKQVVKVGLIAGQRLQVMTAEMREQAEDIVAEARTEQHSARPSQVSTPAGGKLAAAAASPSSEASGSGSGAARRRRAGANGEP